jgi:hypothetical protein
MRATYSAVKTLLGRCLGRMAEMVVQVGLFVRPIYTNNTPLVSLYPHFLVSVYPSICVSGSPLN